MAPSVSTPDQGQRVPGRAHDGPERRIDVISALHRRCLACGGGLVTNAVRHHIGACRARPVIPDAGACRYRQLEVLGVGGEFAAPVRSAKAGADAVTAAVVWAMAEPGSRERTVNGLRTWT